MLCWLSPSWWCWSESYKDANRYSILQSQDFSKKEIKRMKPIEFIGLVLIVLGVMVFVLQFITVTTHVEGSKLGPFTSSSTEAKTTIPVSPVIGVVALAGGIVLVILGRKRKP